MALRGLQSAHPVNMGSVGRGNSNSRRSSSSCITLITSAIMSGCIFFYLGCMVGINSGVAVVHRDSTATATTAMSDSMCCDEMERLKADRDRLNRELNRVKSIALQLGLSAKNLDENIAAHTIEAPRFPQSVSKFAHGQALIHRNNFSATFDTGVPLDPTMDGNEHVLLLYNRDVALPNDRTMANAARKQGDIPVFQSALEATENCDYLNIILTDFRERRAQCWALMGQYEAFHIQKYMRLPIEKGLLDRKHPLRSVNRGASHLGRKSTDPPTTNQTLEFWKLLSPYLTNLPQALERLDPVAKQVAGKSNTVVVMVCNFGQAELLMNFICHAKSRQLDLSHILLFATDVETKDLAENLGITVWYDPETFGDMPKEAARRYADAKFTKMMMAKVYCVQMMAMLSYDFLFQDVDLVWFKDPLAFFHDKSNPWYDFDIYFQDDGNHAIFYAPYSANTGFYYVRHNERTQYFFNALLMNGDLVLGSHSHQIALIAVLNEHASLYGLKPKILARDQDEFPGGYHYHWRKPFMRQYVRGKTDPYIFHMSWTNSKVNKKKFFEQLGVWHWDSSCSDKTLQQIGGNAHSCCLAKPRVVCHFRDKASIKPCKDFPSIDKDRPSFW